MRNPLIGWLAALCLAAAALPASAQRDFLPNNKRVKPVPRPRLVVGIVVDQMRYDFIYRYWDRLPARGGFKRLLNQGFQYTDAHYNYVPTYTGPGHACIYTGATPSANGIVGNNWYVREGNRTMYVTEDPNVETVGSTSEAGRMSPKNLLSTTITDELRLHEVSSKVVGVCLKDRGAILPAGHFPTGAYWFDGATGNWITSTFYNKELPGWVKTFNARRRTDSLLSQKWELMLAPQYYTASTSDDMPWENVFAGEQRPVFPHNLPAIKAAQASAAPYDLIRSTPYGNTLTVEFATAALYGENLGKSANTDFLTVSFSSTDYVTHFFGPNAIETEDTYLRLDRDIGALLDVLEKELGRDQVLVFLTADHGGGHSVGFLEQRHIPAGSVGPVQMRDSLQHELVRQYGPGNWVLAYDNQQVYLNRPLIQQRKLDLEDFQQATVHFMEQFAGVNRAITATDLTRSHWEEGLLMYLENGFYPKRCGDVLVVLEPGWLEGYTGPLLKGTTHGSNSNYDTHVPLIFWGWNVHYGESSAPARVIDIAPTIAQFLHIQEPSGCTGRPLREVLER